MIHHLHRPTCRPEHDAALVPTPHLQSILVMKPYEHSNHRHTRHRTYFTIVQRARLTSTPAIHIDRIHIASAESCLSGSKAADPLAGDRFLYFLFASGAMSSVQPSNGYLCFTGFVSVRASTNNLTMSLLSVLLFKSIFCVFTKSPPAFRGDHTS